MSGFRALYLRDLRRRPGRVALASAAVVISSALVTAVLALHESVLASVDGLVDLAGSADIEVSGVGDTGFEEGLLDEVTGAPGVGEAIPAVRTRVAAGGRPALLLGLDERAERLDQDLADRVRRRIESAPSSEGAYLGAPLARQLRARVGDRIQIVGHDGRRHGVEVAGVLDGPDVSRVNRGLVVAAALPTAQAVSGRPGRLDVTWVIAESGASRTSVEGAVRTAVGERAVVSSPRLRAQQASADVESLRQLFLVIAMAVVSVAAFLVFNTATMVALERRREVATLRALGGRRRALLLGLLGEAAVLGVTGGVVGAAVGLAVGRVLVDALPPVVASAVGVDLAYRPLPLPMFVGLGTAIVATVLAALPPGLGVVRVPPVEAMRHGGGVESVRPERVRWAVAGAGLLATAAGAGALARSSGARAGVAVAVLIGGSLIASFGLMPLVVGAAGAIVRRAGPAGQLAAVSLGRAPRRTWATATGVSLAVMLVVAIDGVNRNQQETSEAIWASLADRDVVLQTAALDDFPLDILMPTSWRGGLARLPDVENVWRELFTRVTMGGDRVVVHGFEAGGHAAFLRLASPSARRALFAGTGVVVNDRFAQRHAVGEGDTLAIPTPSGDRRLRVVAVIGLPVISAGGMIGLPADSVEAWYGRAGASIYELDVASGARPEDVVASAERFAEGAALPVVVATGTEGLEAVLSTGNRFSVAFAATSWVAAVAAALAVLNTLMISVVQRRRELGILRAVGAGRRHLMRAVAAEALGIAAIGAAAGGGLGLLVHASAVEGSTQLVGFPLRYRVSLLSLAVGAAAALAIAAIGALAPARRAAAVDVVDAIGYE